MEKRYQVFISSTFRDLEQERQEVMNALLELDCIPSGMELFPAADKAQWNLITKIIDDCDYYLLILGGRYGSIGPDGISYTEMEYHYALSTGKPIIAFLHRNPGKIIADNSESSVEGKKKLQQFRKLVEKKVCKYWETPQDLGSVVSRSLIQLIKSNPAIGWVRANQLADQEATREILQLRHQVEELQAELERTRTSAPKGTEDLAQGKIVQKVHFSFSITTSIYEIDTNTSYCEPTWDQIFATISPLMIHEAPDTKLRLALNEFISEHGLSEILKSEFYHNKEIYNFQIRNEDFQKILIQFRALGLVRKSEKSKSIKDTGTYWSLTPYGDEVMTNLLAVRHDVTGNSKE